MRSILIIEPIGNMGSILIQGLLDEGYWVTALVEKQFQLVLNHARLEILERRYWIYRELVSTMEGHHIVLLFNTIERDISKQEQNVIDAMYVNHIPNYIILKPRNSVRENCSNGSVFLYNSTLVFDQDFKGLIKWIEKMTK